jgi:predicted site-specific integrase-resolvase
MSSSSADNKKPPPVGRQALRVAEWCTANAVCRATAYRLMREGRLPYFVVGQSGDRRIPINASEALKPK